MGPGRSAGAEAFASALDSGARRRRDDGPDGAPDAPRAADVPGSAEPEVHALLALAERLRDVDVEGPSTEFRDALRQRLGAVAHVHGMGTRGLSPEGVPVREDAPAPSRRRDDELVRRTGRNLRRRLAVVATGLAVVTAAGGGVAAAGVSALPGDLLYPVRETYEAAQRATAADGADRGLVLLGQASRRLQETEALADDDADLQTITDTWLKMDAQTEEGSREVLSALDAGDGSPAAAALEDWAQGQREGVQAARTWLPGSLEPARESSQEDLDLLIDRAEESPPTG